MFKFNFLDEKPSDTSWKAEKSECKNCEELFLQDSMKLSLGETVKTVSLGFDGSKIEIRYLAADDLIRNIKEQNTAERLLLEVENKNSDLVSGVYEGGLKIWECTFDLLNFIIEEETVLKSKNVMDLGCGAGIIGILAMLKNARGITFQDYNEEVLKYATIPNILLNKNSNDINLNFYSGDWDSFVNRLLLKFKSEDDKFDYIFTSETIYNRDNYEKLHRVFKETLKKDGKVYLAAKSHYFGIGGGVDDFIQYTDYQNTFFAQKCWESDSGMKREIILLKFK